MVVCAVVRVRSIRTRAELNLKSAYVRRLGYSAYVSVSLSRDALTSLEYILNSLLGHSVSVIRVPKAFGIIT